MSDAWLIMLPLSLRLWCATYGAIRQSVYICCPQQARLRAWATFTYSEHKLPLSEDWNACFTSNKKKRTICDVSFTSWKHWLICDLSTKGFDATYENSQYCSCDVQLFVIITLLIMLLQRTWCCEHGCGHTAMCIWFRRLYTNLLGTVMRAMERRCLPR